MALGAARRDVLAEQLRRIVVEAVGGDRGGVDESPSSGAGRRLEDVARAVQVDLAALAAAGDDDEGEVDDDLGARDQSLDRLAIEDVPPAVLDLLPAICGGIEGTPCHPDHPADPWRSLQRGEERLADLAGRA